MQAGSRLLRAQAQVLVAGGDFAAGGGDVAGRVLHLVHQGAQRLLHAPHGLHQLAHFVLLLCTDFVRQVTGCDVLGQIPRLRQRACDGAHAGQCQRHQHGQRHQQGHADEPGHGRGARIHRLARLVHLLARALGQGGEQLVGGLHVLLELVRIRPGAGTIELGILQPVKDGADAFGVLLDLGQRLVHGLGKGGICRLRTTHLTQALAQRREGLAPALAQLAYLNGVVVVDDDVLLRAAQVAQRGAQIGHVGQRLHALGEQHLQRGARAV